MINATKQTPSFAPPSERRFLAAKSPVKRSYAAGSPT